MLRISYSKCIIYLTIIISAIECKYLKTRNVSYFGPAIWSTNSAYLAMVGTKSTLIGWITITASDKRIFIYLFLI